MSLTSGEMSAADIAAVTRNNDGFGMDGSWWIVILFLALFNGGWGGNGYGNYGGNGVIPNYLYASNTDALINNRFDTSAISGQLTGIGNAIANGFASAEVANCNRAMNDLERSFASQTAITGGLTNISSQLASCCCENRLASSDLKYTIATENCADRQALNEGVRDIIASQTAGIQTILDKLCQQEIDAKNDEIAQLRQEVLYARGQASQVAQNQQIVDSIYNRLDTCPVGTTPVYGRTPIFTCNGTTGCGCGM